MAFFFFVCFFSVHILKNPFPPLSQVAADSARLKILWQSESFLKKRRGTRRKFKWNFIATFNGRHGPLKQRKALRMFHESIWSNYSDPHDLTPNGGLVREIPLFQGNLGWWNIIIGQRAWISIFDGDKIQQNDLVSVWWSIQYCYSLQYHSLFICFKSVMSNEGNL